MTLKEFSVKYDVPYNIVYDASCEMTYTRLSPYDPKHYDEKNMISVISRILGERISRYRSYADKYEQTLKRLV